MVVAIISEPSVTLKECNIDACYVMFIYPKNLLTLQIGLCAYSYKGMQESPAARWFAMILIWLCYGIIIFYELPIK